MINRDRDREWLGVCEEMQRLVLVSRWIRWALRNYRAGEFANLSSRMRQLSARLKPTWEQRNERSKRD